MQHFSKLFSECRVGALTVPNRICMAPMTRCRADNNRAPTDLVAEYYAQRASAGLLISEATQVSPIGIGYLGTPGIHSAEQVAGWRKVTDRVHAKGGRIFMQLWHVGRVSHVSLLPAGERPVAPSAITAKGMAFTVTGPQPLSEPRELALSEIPAVVDQYRKGAELARQAGFDGVEIHGANGYLVDQFLRDGSNKRTDAYGGSIENRARFGLEVVKAVIGVWGADRVGFRLSPNGTFNDMRDSNPVATFTYMVQELSKLRLAYLHLIELMDGDSLLVPLAKLRAVYSGVLMTNGGYTAERAEEVLQEGLADLVAFGKPYIANPDLPERIQRGVALAPANSVTFYGGTEVGYTDYPRAT